MTLMDKFYNKLTQEYNDYMEEVSNWDGEVVYNNAEFISDYEKIYNYLISEKPITENAFLDHSRLLRRGSFAGILPPHGRGDAFHGASV